MTTCLFAMEDWPITPMAAGGASALIYSHLELMARAVDRVVLVILSNPKNPLGFEAYKQTQPEVWKIVSGWCNEIHIIDLVPEEKNVSAPGRIISGLFEPALYSYDSLVHSASAKNLKKMIENISPDLIWAEHLIPATLIQQIVHDRPVIYSHHDWRWKIKSHRSGSTNLKQKINFWFSWRHEMRLTQRATGCVSGSATELDEIRALGGKQLGYFPTTYPPTAPPEATPLDEHPRIVHLGGMQTTANRLGLQRFLEISLPILIKKTSLNPEIYVIGNLDGASPQLLNAFKKNNINCTGIIADLRTVLRPFDIHIIPWEHNTGTRTRIPLVLNHSQVLLSTRAAASCLPELIHDENCILVNDLQEMASAIIDLFQDEEKRIRIGKCGRESFLSFFTRESQQPQFNAFIEGILKNS